jgi:hypothetical protein
MAVTPVTSKNTDRRRLVLGALGSSIVIVAVLTGLLALLHQPANRGNTAGGPPSSPISPGAPGLPATPTSSTVPTTLPANNAPPTSPPTTTATTVAANGIATSPGQLVLSTDAIDFGDKFQVRYLTISNSGGSPLPFSTAVSSQLLAISPGSSTVQPGETATVAVFFDRRKATPGSFSGTITVTAGTGSATLSVTASVPAPPAPGLSITKEQFSRQKCTVGATITGPAPLHAYVTWSASVTPVDMTNIGGDQWSAPVTVSPASDVTWSVTAVDGNGATKTTPDHTATNVQCSG